MTCYALRGPCCEVLVDALWDAAGLETEAVAAEVDGLVVGVDVWGINAYCYVRIGRRTLIRRSYGAQEWWCFSNHSWRG